MNTARTRPGGWRATLAVASLAAGLVAVAAPANATDPAKPAPPPAAPVQPDNCTYSTNPASTSNEFASCIGVTAGLDHIPAVGDVATLSVNVKASAVRKSADIQVDLPSNLAWADSGILTTGLQTAASTDGVGTVSRLHVATNLSATAGYAHTYKVRAIATGPATIRVRALAPVATGTDGNSANVYLTIGATAATSSASIATTNFSTVAAAKPATASKPANFTPAPKDPALDALAAKTKAAAAKYKADAAKAATTGATTDRPNPTTDSTICASGAWYFVDNNSVTKGAVNEVVQVWDVNTFGNSLITWGYVAWDGSYSLCFSNAETGVWPFDTGTADVYVRFVATNNRWRVLNGANELAFVTGVTNDATTNLNYGGLQPGDNSLMRGLHAFDAVNKGWNFTGSVHGANSCWDAYDTSCGQITVNWSPTSTDGTYESGGQVHLAADDPNAESTVLHETGHAIMYDIYNGNFPSAPNCNPHYIFGVSSQGCAWTEGWAEWFPATVLNDPYFRWPNGASQALESPTWGSYPGTEGDATEGNIAGSLIGISDNAPDGTWDFYSEYPLQPGNIWQTILQGNPITLGDFWNKRASEGYDTGWGLYGAGGALFQHTVNYSFGTVLPGNASQNKSYPAVDHVYADYQTTNYWNGVAIRPSAGNDDDLAVYDTYLGSYLAGSAYGGNTVDYVVLDGNQRAVNDWTYPVVHNFLGGHGNYDIEYSTGTCTQGDGTRGVFLGAGDTLQVCDTFMSSGVTEYFRVVPANVGQSGVLNLHHSDAATASTFAQGRPSAVASASGVGVPFGFTYTPAYSKWDGLVLVNQAGSGTYTVYRDSTAPTGSASILTGAANTNNKTPTVDIAATDLQTGVMNMQVSTDGVFDTEPVVAYSTSATVTICPAGCLDGVKTVWVRFQNNAGQWSAPVSDDIYFTRVNLKTTAESAAPATGTVGTTWTITDTVANSGLKPDTVTTKQKYFLSLDKWKGGTDIALTGFRTVPILANGASNTGSTVVTIAAGTPAGKYYVLSCADATFQVKEYLESDNCTFTAAKIIVS